jgi:hypothetical protein
VISCISNGGTVQLTQTTELRNYPFDVEIPIDDRRVLRVFILKQLLLTPRTITGNMARLRSLIRAADPVAQPAIVFIRPQSSGEDIVNRSYISGLKWHARATAAKLTTTKPRPCLHHHIRQQIKVQDLNVDIPLLMIKDMSLLPTALSNLAREIRYPSRIPICPGAKNIGRSRLNAYFVHHVTFASVEELCESLRDVAGKDFEFAGVRLMADLGFSGQESEQILEELMGAFDI